MREGREAGALGHAFMCAPHRPEVALTVKMECASDQVGLLDLRARHFRALRDSIPILAMKLFSGKVPT